MVLKVVKPYFIIKSNSVINLKNQLGKFKGLSKNGFKLEFSEGIYDIPFDAIKKEKSGC